MKALAWLAALLPLVASPVAAQTTGTLGVAASVIEYRGFLSTGAVVVAPGLRYDSPTLSVAAQGGLTVFESGNEVVQGTLAGAWFVGTGRGVRMEFFGSAGASRYASASATAHLLGGGRLHVFGERAGGWIGGSAGGTVTAGGDLPVEITVAGWTVVGGLSLVGTATATRAPNRDGYADFVMAARWARPWLEVEARAGARAGSLDVGREAAPRNGGYGEVAALVPINRSIALTLGAGRYPTDPVRNVLGATYFNAGFQVRFAAPAVPRTALYDPSRLRDRIVPEGSPTARLEITEAQGLRRIRIRAPGARSVEIMADFTDWTAVRLDHLGDGAWETVLPVTPGVHRLNVRLNGGPWITPEGARLETNEFGGTVGIVVVPG